MSNALRLGFVLLALAGYAKPAVALQITLHLSLEEVSCSAGWCVYDYAADATGDVPWSALAFGIRSHLRWDHLFTPNRANFEGAFGFTSANGDSFYGVDTLTMCTIGPPSEYEGIRRGVDQCLPADVPISVGSLSVWAAASTSLPFTPGSYWLADSPGDLIAYRYEYRARWIGYSYREAGIGGNEGFSATGRVPIHVTVNPEPGTLALLGLSVLSLLALRRRASF